MFPALEPSGKMASFPSPSMLAMDQIFWAQCQQHLLNYMEQFPVLLRYVPNQGNGYFPRTLVGWRIYDGQGAPVPWVDSVNIQIFQVLPMIWPHQYFDPAFLLPYYRANRGFILVSDAANHLMSAPWTGTITVKYFNVNYQLTSPEPYCRLYLAYIAKPYVHPYLERCLPSTFPVNGHQPAAQPGPSQTVWTTQWRGEREGDALHQQQARQQRELQQTAHRERQERALEQRQMWIDQQRLLEEKRLREIWNVAAERIRYLERETHALQEFLCQEEQATARQHLNLTPAEQWQIVMEAERQQQMASAEERQQQMVIEAERQRQIVIEVERQRQMVIEAERQRQMTIEAEHQWNMASEEERQRKMMIEAERQRHMASEEDHQQKMMIEAERQRHMADEEERKRQMAIAEERQWELAKVEEIWRQTAEGEEHQRQIELCRETGHLGQQETSREEDDQEKERQQQMANEEEPKQEIAKVEEIWQKMARGEERQRQIELWNEAGHLGQWVSSTDEGNQENERQRLMANEERKRKIAKIEEFWWQLAKGEERQRQTELRHQAGHLGQWVLSREEINQEEERQRQMAFEKENEEGWNQMWPPTSEEYHQEEERQRQMALEKENEERWNQMWPPSSEEGDHQEEERQRQMALEKENEEGWNQMWPPTSEEEYHQEEECQRQMALEKENEERWNQMWPQSNEEEDHQEEERQRQIALEKENNELWNQMWMASKVEGRQEEERQQQMAIEEHWRRAGIQYSYDQQ